METGIIRAFAGMAQGGVTLLSIAQRNFKDIMVDGELSEDRVVKAVVDTLQACLQDNNASRLIQSHLIQMRAMQLFVDHPDYDYNLCMAYARQDAQRFLSFINLTKLGIAVTLLKQQLADIWIPALEATQANIAEGFDESYINGAFHATVELLEQAA